MHKQKPFIIMALLITLWSVLFNIYQLDNYKLSLSQDHEVMVSACTSSKNAAQNSLQTCQETKVIMSSILPDVTLIMPLVSSVSYASLVILCRLPIYPHTIDKPPRLLGQQ